VEAADRVRTGGRGQCHQHHREGGAGDGHPDPALEHDLADAPDHRRRDHAAGVERGHGADDQEHGAHDEGEDEEGGHSHEPQRVEEAGGPQAFGGERRGEGIRRHAAPNSRIGHGPSREPSDSVDERDHLGLLA
jgi:hypothetical protein